ncbi:hypothetical protein BGX27_007337 [Mortierella sp. AM989]|nr:hypothetical protein BGX27_007337 [Mortierella sp. AM989]
MVNPSLPTPTISYKRCSKFTTLLLSLTIACFILSSSTSGSCTATPIPKTTRQQHQRSIAQQVHHVQLADESVHNTLMLIKKSMQKKKKLQAQAEKKQLPKKRLQKRQVEGSSPVLGDNARADIETETLNLNQAQTLIQTQSSRRPSNQGTNGITEITRTRARLISAYETIVFSESQIPVFLSQDHSRLNRKGRFNNNNVNAYLETVGDKTPVSGPTDKPPSHNKASSDNDNIEPSQINIALSKRGIITETKEMKDALEGVLNSIQSHCSDENNDVAVNSNTRDKNSLVDTLSPSTPKAVTEVQEEEYHILMQGDIPPTSTTSDVADLHTTLDQDDIDNSSSEYLPQHNHDYQNYAYMYHGCVSTPAILLVLLPVMILIAYRVYIRRQRHVAYLLLPPSSPLASTLSDSQLKAPRRASESSRNSRDMSSFVGYNTQE